MPLPSRVKPVPVPLMPPLSVSVSVALATVTIVVEANTIGAEISWVPWLTAIAASPERLLIVIELLPPPIRV